MKLKKLIESIFEAVFEEIILQLNTFRKIVWNKGIKLWWYRLFIRANEFDVSLDMDVEAISVMDRAERSRYAKELSDRRHKAHLRSLPKKYK